MIAIAQSLEQFLKTKYPEKLERVKSGFIEEYEEIKEEYYAWCDSCEGKKYTAGGEFFIEC